MTAPHATIRVDLPGGPAPVCPDAADRSYTITIGAGASTAPATVRAMTPLWNCVIHSRPKKW